MSISQDSGAVIVCREVFDEDSRPSNEEVLDYAKRLGIDPDAEPHLLDLARAGLMAPLPKGWSPCLDEATGAWYYYQASTRTTTWEHPLDARHRELVERARARAAAPRQLSLDDDSKTTARELDSHEEASVPKDSPKDSLKDSLKDTQQQQQAKDTAAPHSKVPVSTTKIPTKLVPIGRKTILEPIARRKDSSVDRLHRRSTVATDTSRSDNPSTASLMTDRASRDYTSVVFQDPKFYETPRLLDSPERERRLQEIVKRSESMSPRYEKDWEQLSSRFSCSDENVIDIDRLSASSLARSESRQSPEKFDKEKHPRNLSQQKELTLSGGGSMFLKSNRSRDATPCQETAPPLEDFQRAALDALDGAAAAAGGDCVAAIGATFGERPKSILREKPADDEERPTDAEERKSVRFDLEREPRDIKFTFSAFEDDVEDPADTSDSESDASGDGFAAKTRESAFSSLRRVESKPRAGLSGLGWLSDLDSAGRTSDDENKAEDDDDDEDNDMEGHARRTGASGATDDEERGSEGGKAKVSEGHEEETSSTGKTEASADDKDTRSREENAKDAETAKESAVKVNEPVKRSQVVGRRFVVQNVSEKEHLNQLTRVESSDVDRDILPSSKFSNVKNIDLFSRSETDNSTTGGGDTGSIPEDSRTSLLLDEIRRSKELMMENMKMSDRRVKRDKQKERDEVYHMVKLRHDLEAVSQERGRHAQRNFDDVRTVMSKQHDRELATFKRQLEASLDRARRETEATFAEEKTKLERDLEKRLEDLRAELARKEKEEIEKLVAEMDELRLENLKKVRNELEICYEKERQDILENLKTELDQRKRELLDLRNQEMEKLQSEHDKSLADEKVVMMTERDISREHTERIEAMRRELDKEFDDLRNELRAEQREKVTKITEDHEKCLAEILRDFRADEGVARKVYKQRLEEIRSDFSRDTDKEAKKIAERVSRQETVDYEKIRCEKRLLEDKYKTLKDKYSKLKNDVRLAVERRSKRKEGNTTTSETEKSTSARTRTERTDPSDQKASPTNTRSSSIANPGRPAAADPGSHNPARSVAEDSEGAQRSSAALPRSSIGHGSAGVGGDCSSRSSAKFESDDATTASETVNSNILKNKRKSFARRSTSSAKQSHNNNNGADNPVENIRKQLEKLEDLGDQLPSNESAYTLRYPFQDKAPANASSELEFFRHRIHVERDSVKRARDALRVQRSAFQSRQRAWKQRSARATLEQLVQEERELSDMEVSLHRTRSLLGEKVIYLRHLEQSLERVANAKRNETESIPLKNDEMTLSDMSSASSGFSSTDLGTDTFIDKPDHYQESTEIIASLENLNSEIREIWGVLNKRQDNNIPPPPTLMYSDLGWLPFQHLTTQSSNVQGFGTPNIQSNILSQLTAAHPPTTTTQNIIAQYGPNSGFTTSVGTVERGASSLIERTRHMRDWLRQARIESTDLISPGQATL